MGYSDSLGSLVVHLYVMKAEMTWGSQKKGGIHWEIWMALDMLDIG